MLYLLIQYKDGTLFLSSFQFLFASIWMTIPWTLVNNLLNPAREIEKDHVEPNSSISLAFDMSRQAFSFSLTFSICLNSDDVTLVGKYSLRESPLSSKSRYPRFRKDLLVVRTHALWKTYTHTHIPTQKYSKTRMHKHIDNTHTHSQQSHLSTHKHNTHSHTHLYTYSHSHSPIHTHKYTQSENKPQWASQGQTLSYLLLP